MPEMEKAVRAMATELTAMRSALALLGETDHVTLRVGSGLFGLLRELSKWAVQRICVPRGSCAASLR